MRDEPTTGRDSLALERTDLDARHWDGCKALPKQRSFAERWNGSPGVSPVIEEGEALPRRRSLGLEGSNGATAKWSP